jgi:TetR/AcrR family transcriptional regulator, mexJK operon transcriptional repressor
MNAASSEAGRKLSRTRRDILQAARAAFLELGYGAASMDAIAEAAGVSKQTIYNNFRDKTALFLAVARAAQEAAEVVQAASLDVTLADHRDVAGALDALLQTWLGEFLRPELMALRRLVAAEAERVPELREGWVSGAPRRFHQVLRDLLGKAAARGELRLDDPDLAASQLITLVGGQAQQIATFGGRALTRAEINDVVRVNLSMFLRAYRP